MTNDKIPYIAEVTVYDDWDEKNHTYYPLLYAHNMSEAMRIIEDYYGVDKIENCRLDVANCGEALFEVDKLTAQMMIIGSGNLIDGKKIYEKDDSKM